MIWCGEGLDTSRAHWLKNLSVAIPNKVRFIFCEEGPRIMNLCYGYLGSKNHSFPPPSDVEKFHRTPIETWPKWFRPQQHSMGVANELGQEP